jgi:hypothetical protein
MMRLYWPKYINGANDNYIKQYYPHMIYVSDCVLYRQPYQLWLDMQMKGSTYTINSYMNPVRIKGDVVRMQLSYTNRNVDEPFTTPDP